MGIYVRLDKRPNARTHYWLVCSYRERGRIVQKRLKYLGTLKPSSEDVENAIKEVQHKIPSHMKEHRHIH